MIQELAYTINTWEEKYFHVSGEKYDFRMAISVIQDNLDMIAASYRSSLGGPNYILNYKNYSDLSYYLKKLTPRSKLLLSGHGGEIALREKSVYEAIPTKPDFSVDMASDVIVKEAPQLRDIGDEAPTQLFKISIASCQALGYGLNLSRSLAKQGISNRITARTWNVGFVDCGKKNVFDPSLGLSALPHHRRTGTKLLFTTYAQCPALSQVEFVNYEGKPANQFVWIPDSIKPLQNVDIKDHSLQAYQSLFQAIKMLGMSTPPLSLLWNAIQNTKDAETLRFLASMYFPENELGQHRLKECVEQILRDSLPIEILQFCPVLLSGTLNDWLKLAIDYRLAAEGLKILIRHIRAEKEELLLTGEILTYALEKEIRGERLQVLLAHACSYTLSRMIGYGLEKEYGVDILVQIFQNRAACASFDKESSDISYFVYEIVAKIFDKKITPSFVESIVPYLTVSETVALLENILRKGGSKTEFIPFHKALLPYIKKLPDNLHSRKMVLKYYPELQKLKVVERPKVLYSKISKKNRLSTHF